MRTEAINYETLSQISHMVSSSRDMDDVATHIVHSLVDVLDLKGCALMLLDRGTDELHVAASHGLSDTYLNKGPLSALQSIAESLKEGPTAIYDVNDDPRLQYPKAAVAEGIKSIMSVPIIIRDKPIGVLRLYTHTPWDFTDQDMIFTQAVAEIIGLVLDNLRMYKGLKSSIDVLKELRPPIRPTKRTLHE